MNKRSYIYVFALLALASALSACSPDTDSSATRRDVIDVKTSTLAATTQPDYIELTGTVTGRQTVPIATKLMSEITFMGFEEGERVMKGALLARIDDSDLQAMQAEAAAYRAEAAAALAEVDAAISQGEAGKAQAEAAVKQAEAAHADAQADYERAERLAAEDSIPRVQRDKAELGFRIATENLAKAQSGVVQAEAQIEQARAKIPQVEAKEDQAAAKGAQVIAMQDYATLTAPFDGVITERLSDPGQLAIPGQPIYMLADDSAFRLELNIAESLVGNLALGMGVEVLLQDAATGYISSTGTVSSINAAANPGSHTVKVKLDLLPTPGLFAGRFARARIPAGEHHALCLPTSAVVKEGEQQFVWRVSASSTLSKVPVEVADLEDGICQVIRGLSAGDTVVLEPTPDLYSGAKTGPSNSGSDH